VRTERDGDLHGVEAHPAGGAVHEHAVALADLERLGERLVGGQPRQWQGARLREGQRLRLVGETPLRRRHERRRRPPLDVVAPHVAEDLVARCEVHDRGAGGLDDAGDVPARRDREVVGVRAGEVALADRHVDRIDPGRVHPHQHCVGADRGLGQVVAELEDVLAAEAVVGDASHRRPFR
jgi:hypothetical protein